MLVFLWTLQSLIVYVLVATTSVSATNTTDRHIIVLRSEASLAQHLGKVQHLLTLQDATADFAGIVRTYSIATFCAYAGHFSASLLRALHQDPDVAFIEPNRPMHAAGIITQRDATFGLGLLSSRKVPYWTDRLVYIYSKPAGAGTYAYILDTGIDPSHQDLLGRAVQGHNVLSQGPAHDTYGHGTHIAGTIGGTRFGVAKRCTLIAVKVLDAHGDGDMIDTLDGYAWAVRDVLRRHRQARAVINISITGAYSRAINQAIEVAFAHGVTTVAAAGNYNENAALASPASSRAAITVAATDWVRQRWEASNWGPAVDIFAPGVDVVSASIESDTAMGMLTGTSSAAAHVAGLVLYLKSRATLPDARATKKALIDLATRDAVPHAKGSRNLFAYNGAGDF